MNYNEATRQWSLLKMYVDRQVLNENALEYNVYDRCLCYIFNRATMA